MDLEVWRNKVDTLIDTNKETDDANVRTALNLYAAVAFEIESLKE